MEKPIVKDAALREAAGEGMDAFLKVFIDAIMESIGGELNAETMTRLNVDQITLLAYNIVHEEVMDGGFVQLIYNGYGGFIYLNPFAKVLKVWGLDDMARVINKTGKLYRAHRAEIECECSDEDFMALFEKFPKFDEFDDLFVENEEQWTECVARYVDEHIDNFVTIEDN